MAASEHDMKMIIPHVHNSRTKNRFENRLEIVILHMEDLKRFMFCHSSQNQNTLLLYRFKKNRQNVLRKETYLGSSQAAAIVFEALAPEPPRATRSTPKPVRNFAQNPIFFFHFSEISRDFSQNPNFFSFFPSSAETRSGAPPFSPAAAERAGSVGDRVLLSGRSLALARVESHGFVCSPHYAVGQAHSVSPAEARTGVWFACLVLVFSTESILDRIHYNSSR
jgi:hypothetical protein